MTTYYTSENGKITERSNKPFPGSIETDREIIRGYDGALYFAGEEPVDPGPSPEELQRQYLSAVDARMTAIANTRGYDSVESAAKYIGNTRNETWAAEGEALRDWAIDVYEACYAILGRVMAGETPIPSIGWLFDMLPDMVWPDGKATPMRGGDAQA